MLVVCAEEAGYKHFKKEVKGVPVMIIYLAQFIFLAA